MSRTEELVTALRIQLPESLYALFEDQAKQSNCTIEEILVRRLQQTKDLDNFSGRTVKLEPAQRQRVEKLFGRSFQTGADLVHYLEGAYTLKVGGVDVQLSGECLKRVQSRAIRRPYEELLREVITRQVEHFVGLR